MQKANETYIRTVNDIKVLNHTKIIQTHVCYMCPSYNHHDVLISTSDSLFRTSNREGMSALSSTHTVSRSHLHLVQELS